MNGLWSIGDKWVLIEAIWVMLHPPVHEQYAYSMSAKENDKQLDINALKPWRDFVVPFKIKS